MITEKATHSKSRTSFQRKIYFLKDKVLSFFALGLIISVLLPAILQARTPDPLIGIPGVQGGVVTTTETAATRVGADILRQGGNAIDAAAAVAFTLNVVEPQSSGIGGGGFMMIYLSKTKETVVVDSRETAPSLASADMFLDTQGHPFPYRVRSTSGIAVGVPGMVRGVSLALHHWGTFSLAEILTPATKMASEGIRISNRLASEIREAITDGRLSKEPGHPAYEVARKVFAPNGVPPNQGDLLVQPHLAKTLRLIAKHGPDLFYTGKIADAIVATQHHARTLTNPLDQKKLHGRMTMHDLADYQSKVCEPIEGSYRGFKIRSAPSPSSGGLTVLHILKLLEHFPIGDRTQGFEFGSTRTLNVIIEAMRLAFADRAVWMGDADFVPVPVDGLLNPQYIESRSALIHPDTRQGFVSSGNPLPFDKPSDFHRMRIQESPSSMEEGLNTTHFTIIDREGNIVTYTNTIESRWGTGLMVPGFGFLLNNELTDFNAVPALNTDPQHFNPGANDVAPGKRPRSSMAPTIVYHQDYPIAAYGSPGGSTIINSVLNVTLNLLDHDMSLQEAIDAPRISITSANGSLTLEAQLSANVLDNLKKFGHPINDNPFQVIGAVQGVVIDPSNGNQFGAADRRRGGSVISIQSNQATGSQ